MEPDYQLLEEIRVLYPYFNTDDLALIFNMSRGWTARKIVSSLVERRSAGETRALPQPTTLPSDVYQVLTTVMGRTGGQLPYTVTCDDSLEQAEGITDIELDEIFSETTVESDNTGVDSTGEDDGGAIVGSEGVNTESEDLVSRIRSERVFNNMNDAYNYLADVTLQLGKRGVFGDNYDALYTAKLATTPPIELGFSQLAELNRRVKNGVDGVDWEVGLRIHYLPSNTDTERLDEYLTGVQQNEQVFAGRFRTENYDRLSVRIVSGV